MIPIVKVKCVVQMAAEVSAVRARWVSSALTGAVSSFAFQPAWTRRVVRTVAAVCAGSVSPGKTASMIYVVRNAYPNARERSAEMMGAAGCVAFVRLALTAKMDSARRTVRRCAVTTNVDQMVVGACVEPAHLNSFV